MSIWVVNTSPLVFLGNLGRLELLCQEGREVYIPRAVAEEIAEKPDAVAQTVQAACATWIQVRNVTDETAVTLVQASLHKGEAKAIVLATELGAEKLVMDDQDARRFANRCGLTVIGTLEFYWLPSSEAPLPRYEQRSTLSPLWDFVPIHDLSPPCYKVQGSRVRRLHHSN
jgi:predicted nucleic acid-binding protein